MSNLDSFRRLGISETTIDALAEKGFEQPSAIQAAAIPLLLAGEQDVIGQARTGTGKTAAFAIPIIEIIRPEAGRVQALILAPTRELTIQIAEEIQSLQGNRRLSVAPIYGGQAIDIQLRRLKGGVDIVVGTPGRVIDLIERKALKLDSIEFAVLDEADEMLNMGFLEEIETILGSTPEQKRMLMFSATMPPPIMKIAAQFMRGYEIIRITEPETDTPLTDQFYFEVQRADKLEALARLIDVEPEIYALVFCRTRSDVDELTEKLQNRGLAVEALHGDVAQAQRTRLIERFKARKFSVLIATDVAARGIDVNHLTHVINYSIPQNSESYIHRIGRTGRAGRRGTAITFVTPAEFRTLNQIKREAKIEIRKGELPDGAAVVNRKKNRILEQLGSVIADNRHNAYRQFAEELSQHHDHTELLAALLRLTYRAELLPETYPELSPGRKRGRERRSGVQLRLFMALGKAEGYGAGKLLELIFQKTGLRSNRIGKVDSFDHFSFLEVDADDAELLLKAFRRAGHDGAPLVAVARAPEEDDADDPTGRQGQRPSDGAGNRRQVRQELSGRAFGRAHAARRRPAFAAAVAGTPRVKRKQIK